MSTPEEVFVDAWMRERGIEQFSYDDNAADELVFDWLKTQPPDAWHKYAISFNWGYGTDAARWIVDQPECDKGTALYLYYAAQPGFYARYPNLEAARAEGADEDAIELMMAICAHWAESRYCDYRFRPSWVADEAELATPEARLALARAVPWDVPEDLAITGFEGEEIAWEPTADGCVNGIGRALDDAIQARFEPWED